MGALPDGRLTLVFTDVEGSTQLLHRLGVDYADALAEHRRILREAFARHDGTEVDTQGDAFFYVFPTADAALAAAGEGCELLEPGPVHVRIGIHTGAPQLTGEGYVGTDVHLAARIGAVGHGGQVVVSGATYRELGRGHELIDLGEHRLKDFDDPELVLEEVGRTLGAREDLARHIGERELLLVLDNFEQVVKGGPAVGDVLSRCPNLHVLVTSRELLRLRDEVEFPVEPLPGEDAVRLFAERSGLPVDETVTALCAALDNLPLAVELAAARTDVLSPAQILDRLERRLDLFRGARDADARQQTLRAAIQWSHELLDEDEQRLFARLAVFAGGCTLDAAEEVVEAELDVLEALVQKSLVRHSGERFWMLETIRGYAL